MAQYEKTVFNLAPGLGRAINDPREDEARAREVSRRADQELALRRTQQAQSQAQAQQELAMQQAQQAFEQSLASQARGMQPAYGGAPLGGSAPRGGGHGTGGNPGYGQERDIREAKRAQVALNGVHLGDVTAPGFDGPGVVGSVPDAMPQWARGIGPQGADLYPALRPGPAAGGYAGAQGGGGQGGGGGAGEPVLGSAPSPQDELLRLQVEATKGQIEGQKAQAQTQVVGEAQALAAKYLPHLLANGSLDDLSNGSTKTALLQELQARPELVPHLVRALSDPNIRNQVLESSKSFFRPSQETIDRGRTLWGQTPFDRNIAPWERVGPAIAGVISGMGFDTDEQKAKENVQSLQQFIDMLAAQAGPTKPSSYVFGPSGTDDVQQGYADAEDLFRRNRAQSQSRAQSALEQALGFQADAMATKRQQVRQYRDDVQQRRAGSRGGR